MGIQTSIGAGGSTLLTLAVSTGTYTTGMVVGGSLSFQASLNPGGRGMIRSLKLAGPTTANPYELWLWNQELATPLNNRDALAIAAADVPNYLGTLTIATTSYFTAVSNRFFAVVPNVNWEVETTGGVNTIVAYLKDVGATTGGAVGSYYLTVDVDYTD